MSSLKKSKSKKQTTNGQTVEDIYKIIALLYSGKFAKLSSSDIQKLKAICKNISKNTRCD